MSAQSFCAAVTVIPATDPRASRYPAEFQDLAIDQLYCLRVTGKDRLRPFITARIQEFFPSSALNPIGCPRARRWRGAAMSAPCSMAFAIAWIVAHVICSQPLSDFLVWVRSLRSALTAEPAQ